MMVALEVLPDGRFRVLEWNTSFLSEEEMEGVPLELLFVPLGSIFDAIPQSLVDYFTERGESCVPITPGLTSRQRRSIRRSLARQL